MSIVSALKGFISGGNDYDEDEEQEFEEFTHRRSPRGGYEDEDDYDYAYEETGRQQRKDNKIVSIHTTAKLQVCIFKPTDLNEASDIADNLMEKKTVVINLERAEKDIANKIILFLQGVAYAQNGQFQKIANSTFIITPFNVDIMANDVIDELENNGLFF